MRPAAAPAGTPIPASWPAPSRRAPCCTTAADCSVDGLYNAGQGITELAGPEEVHIGRNVGPVPVLVEMLYINPAGTERSLDAPDPGCGFA